MAESFRADEVAVDELLSGFDFRTRRLAGAARKLILTAVPHATERVRPGWRLIGYNAPAYFAFISLDRNGVRVGFEWGVMLANPSGLLEGSGSQIRYVAIRTAADLEAPALTTLLRSAAAIVPPARLRGSGR